jgi:sec-independent protein translocase protein TatB
MPSFSDSIFLFILALLLFGPKKLPMLARELGKWVGEFRRASNEFKMQMEEELRLSEQADRQKQIAAMEAAAPVTPALGEPEHPHLAAAVDPEAEAEGEAGTASFDGPFEAPAEPLPIATAGELSLMPPTTGLPVARGANGSGGNEAGENALGGLIGSIPEVQPMSEIEEHARENVLHGD